MNLIKPKIKAPDIQPTLILILIGLEILYAGYNQRHTRFRGRVMQYGHRSFLFDAAYRSPSRRNQSEKPCAAGAYEAKPLATFLIHNVPAWIFRHQ